MPKRNTKRIKGGGVLSFLGMNRVAPEAVPVPAPDTPAATDDAKVSPESVPASAPDTPAPTDDSKVIEKKKGLFGWGGILGGKSKKKSKRRSRSKSNSKSKSKKRR